VVSPGLLGHSLFWVYLLYKVSSQQNKTRMGKAFSRKGCHESRVQSFEGILLLFWLSPAFQYQHSDFSNPNSGVVSVNLDFFRVIYRLEPTSATGVCKSENEVFSPV